MRKALTFLTETEMMESEIGLFNGEHDLLVLSEEKSILMAENMELTDLLKEEDSISVVDGVMVDQKALQNADILMEGEESGLLSVEVQVGDLSKTVRTGTKNSRDEVIRDMKEDEVNDATIMDETSLGLVEEEDSFGGTEESFILAPTGHMIRKKNGKGAMMLKGMSSKKMNVQVLVSPRKKTGTKTTVQIGDGLYKGKGKPSVGKQIPKPSDT